VSTASSRRSPGRTPLRELTLAVHMDLPVAIGMASSSPSSCATAAVSLWRQVFNEYDPPRTAVAEAWVPAARRPRYASQDGLGQAFNFDLPEAGWDAAQFRAIITGDLADAQLRGSCTTWVLSHHDVVRHATRYGLPLAAQAGNATGKAWLQSGGATPALDRELGLRRAHAATMLMLALPGSAYL
jgi:alpha-glucosidase